MKAVIFDLDDTLYPERAYVSSGFAAVADAFAKRFGEPAETARQMERLFDTTGQRTRIFNALLAARGLPEDDELVAAMVRVYRSHRPTIALYEDANAALVRLRKRCKLGLITDGPAESQWAKIRALALPGRLDELIATSELGSEFGKPNPRAFELMAERLGVDASQCVYVADNPAKDFVAPNALGWTSVRVVRGDGIYRDAATAPGGAPSAEIDSLDHLESVLN